MPKTTICIAGSAVLVLAFAVTIFMAPNNRNRPLSFSRVGVSASSNGSLISIGMTNESNSTIHYYVGSTQSETNGVWYASDGFRFPAGRRMTSLVAGASTTLEITTPLTRGEIRLPVMWSYDYSIPTSRWQEAKEDFKAWLRTRTLRGMGAIYTNYCSDINL